MMTIEHNDTEAKIIYSVLIIYKFFIFGHLLMFLLLFKIIGKYQLISQLVTIIGM